MLNHEQIAAGGTIERYVRRQLPLDQRQAFEEHFFVCDECFEEVQTFERFLAGVQHAGRRGELTAPTRASRWMIPALAFALAACLIVTSAVVLSQREHLKNTDTLLASAKGEIEALRSRLDREGSRPIDTTPEANVPFGILQSARSVGETGAQLAISSGDRHAVLWVDVPGGSGMYRMLVEGPGGQPVSIEGLKPNSQGALAVSLPVSALRAGDYKARLFSEPADRIVGEYSFRVVMK